MPTPFFDRRRSYQTKAAEFWPAWVLQAALYMQGIPLGWWRGGLTWFARVNPGMDWGGMLAYSKSDAMLSLPKVNKAAAFTFDWPIAQAVLQEQRLAVGLSWPLVLKPDQGERGRDVYQLHNELQLSITLQQLPPGKYLLQEFLELPFEFGVFVSKSLRNQQFEVLSLSWKVPLGVMGDGVSTIGELLAQHPRARHYPALLAALSAEVKNTVPAANVWRQLHFSGNHCRGAAFFDAQELIDQALNDSMHHVLKEIEGFRFGRLDVLVAQPQDLWHPEAIKVIEINGANAEPAHIYDPKMPFWRMLAEVLRFQRLMWHQARWMQKQGASAPPLRQLWPVLKAYRSQMRAAAGR
ncbi:MAG: hypothetical protein Q8J69_10015 [Sphingobacteriaceae bacterium]|nr:hypothetical protein [Sphingobacteriaceae bacterium]